MTRRDVLVQACDQCMKELYEYAVPHVTWEQFKKECKEYSKKCEEWEKHNNPEWERKSIRECIGPKPFEFYYLPKEIMKDVCDSYIYAYRIDEQRELLDTIEILKKYCQEPIIEKYIDNCREYIYSDNLHLCLMNLITDSNLNLGNNTGIDIVDLVSKLQNKFFEFLDMAGNFYNWTRDLGTFNTSVYLGPAPNINREDVIENWKKYRNKDIEINEEQIKKKYYEEDYD
jgi:hypothetical protein